MKIIVLIKQVPETSDVRMDKETGTMIREGVESIINPLDLYAIEAGIQLKEKHGGTLTALTMGPPKSEKALREAVAMGCDDAVLLTGKEFAGSDTWTTSYVLSEAIRQRIPGFDLILCGERATDGDTGQVGPGVASFLDLPIATYVSRIYDIAGGRAKVNRLVEGGYEILTVPFPALITVVKEISFPRLPTLRGKRRARTLQIPAYASSGIMLEKNRLGLKGSPTRVVKIFTPKVVRECRKLFVKEPQDLEKAADAMIEYMADKQLI